MTDTGGGSRREQLLDAAVRTFTKAGYSATRVSDIVSEAGVAQGTFYLYFASKRDIFRQLVERFLTMFADRLLTASFDDPDDLCAFRETARARVLFTLRTCYENRELARIYFQEAMGADPGLNTRLLEFNRAFAHVTCRLGCNTEFGADIFARMILASCLSRWGDWLSKSSGTWSVTQIKNWTWSRWRRTLWILNYTASVSGPLERISQDPANEVCPLKLLQPPSLCRHWNCGV